MKKLFVNIESTKCDMYGNTYHTATITNLKNGKSFTVKANSEGNIISILGKAGISYNQCIYTASYTGSARISSLREAIYLDECRYTEEWKKALNSIGLRVAKVGG